MKLNQLQEVLGEVPINVYVFEDEYSDGSQFFQGCSCELACCDDMEILNGGIYPSNDGKYLIIEVCRV